MNENWSRAGSPLHPKPSCPALGATDWFDNLASRAQSPGAGWIAEQDEQYGMPKVMSAACCCSSAQPAAMYSPCCITLEPVALWTFANLKECGVRQSIAVTFVAGSGHSFTPCTPA